ncbi:MAG: hypothetical protein ACR2GN_04475 [Bacteroidia bacterium]
MFTRNNFSELANHRDDTCISILLPTHRAGHQVNEGEDWINYKSALQRVENQLQSSGMKGDKIKELLKPAKNLLDETTYWHNMSDGLAVFIAHGYFYKTEVPVPFEHHEHINKRFYLKPLVPLLTGEGKFYLLAIAKGSVKFFTCYHHAIEQLELGNLVPKDMEEALRYDDPEKSLQFHSGSGRGEVGPTGGTIRGAMYHGHGGLDDVEKVNLERYLNLVDKGIVKLISGEETPLVLAGVDYLVPIYKKVTNYNNLYPDAVFGNPEHIPMAELHEMAQNIIEPHFNSRKEEARLKYDETKHTERASDELAEVIPAAFYGRVDSLFVNKNKEIYGTFNKENNKLILHGESKEEGDIELLNEAAIHTILNSGTVFLEDEDSIPGNHREIAAILRY